MANNNDITPQDVNNTPNTRKSSDLLPSYHRTDKNIRFLSSTLDQLIQPAQLERIDGFIGSELSPNYNPTTDRYLDSDNSLKSKYQLTPSLIVKDSNDNINVALTYDDLIDQLAFYGANVNNLNRLFENKTYSYDPGIDWDKFINYTQYYWMPTGPDSIEITGVQRDTVSTYSVTDSSDGNSLIFIPDGVTPTPLLTLYRGVTYVFDVTSEYPFYIKTAYVDEIDSLYSEVINNGTASGRVVVTIDSTTPDVLFYFAQGNKNAVGQFVVKNIAENTLLDVDADIIGKQTYQSANGVTFSNGMKVHFVGQVTPSTYLNKEYIVEGVGTAITLVDFSSLKVQSTEISTLDPNFDATNFDQYPFDDFSFLPLTPEYITINRAAPDVNPWSRYNRWVHADVIAATAAANNVPPVYASEYRAQRPIIEFVAGMRLFNSGSMGKGNVDLIDNFTKNAFSTVEGSAGFYIDGILVDQGNRVVFNADTDPLVNGRVYEINFVQINGSTVISLVETEDGEPAINDSIAVTMGQQYAGTSWWYNGSQWVFGQQRTKLNQAPLFELYDNQGNKFSDQSIYNSNFFGTKVFGYEIGSGANDPVLGFPLTYRNVANVGDYLFTNFFMTDTFNNFVNNNNTVLNVADGYLQINSLTGTIYKNVWIESVSTETPIIQFQVVDQDVSFIQITVLDNAATITDLTVDVFVNNKKLILNTEYAIQPAAGAVFIVAPFKANDTVLFKIYTTAVPNTTGYYDVPLGLTNNPLNKPVGEFTLAEISDHVKTMVNTNSDFIGAFPGNGNLRDLKDVSKYGQRLISHGNPLSFAHYYLGYNNNNLIESIRKTSDDYNQFKTAFMTQVVALKNAYNTTKTVDIVLNTLNLNKNETFAYGYSDMLAYGNDCTTQTITVTNSRNVNYSLYTIYDNTVLSERSVLIYLNGNILVLGRDYTFDQYTPTVTIITPLVKGDVIVIKDYVSTVGSYVPPTPTKLGLYPKFTPMIYVDTTYVDTPQTVIQGHDGSITIAYGDYRDDVLLELETRIYNNIKVSYNHELLNVNEVLPGAFRTNQYSLSEITKILSADFLKWVGFFGVDYQTNYIFDQLNPFTFNYSGSVDSISKNSLPGYWRAIYKYFYDTERPHTNPWEMLGFSEQPDWWENVYGPAPYTNGNLILWGDLEAGRIAQGDRAGIDLTYARPGLSTIIPVDESGNLLDPVAAGLSIDSVTDNTDPARISVLRSAQISANWIFGDQAPAETAWRRSSFWPFACQVLLVLTKPNTYTSMLFDVSRMQKNIAGQYKYGDNEIFLNPANVLLYRDTTNGSRVLANGHSVFLIEYGLAKDANYLSKLKKDMIMKKVQKFNTVSVATDFSS